MNDVQALIDRQLGFYYRPNYDSALRRLVVAPEDSFYGLQNVAGATLDQDPPIFACRFAEAAGYEHILALANEDGRVALQDTSKTSPNNIEGFQCHNNAVFDLAWMPRHMSFVTVSGDHTASLWDIEDGSPRRVLVFSGHSKSVKTAVFRPGEPHVFATGARDGHILVWDVRAAAARPALLARPDNRLINCHSGGAPRTPSSHGKRARLEQGARTASITGLVFRDDATLVSCGERDGSIKVWDLRKSYHAHTREPLPKHSIPYCGSSTRNGYTSLLLDEARVRLYASCMDHVIYCFNVAACATLPEQRYAGHESGTFYIRSGLSADCRYLVSGSSDKHAYVWNVRDSAPVVRLAGHAAEVTCAAWGRAPGAPLVTCSDDARHKLWRIGAEHLDAESRRQLQGCAEPVPRAAPHYAALDRTPRSGKRGAPTTPRAAAAKRPRPAPSTKRCLADMMSAAHEAEAGGKRARVSPARDEDAAAWSYPALQPGASFMSPTKNYERRACRKLSPPLDSSSPSPPKVRIISFSTPTENLPNFAVDGCAPHQRLMSPAKRKQDTTDWLTRMRRERLAGGGGGGAVCGAAVVSPARRSSLSERPPAPAPRPAPHAAHTLHRYFNVLSKED